jgi:hypothetical protein
MGATAITVITILCALVFVEMINTLAILQVYGMPIRNRKILDKLESLTVNDVVPNPYSNRIIAERQYGGVIDYIGMVGTSILFKYYLPRGGVIWRFSSTAKKINSLRKELLSGK